jgi:hypothetical protein
MDLSETAEPFLERFRMRAWPPRRRAGARPVDHGVLRTDSPNGD